MEDFKALAAVRPDAQVRLQTSSVPKQWLRGTLLALKPDTLVVQSGSTDWLAIPSALLMQFEVVQGKKRNAGKGALIGLLSGTLADIAFSFAVDVGDSNAPGGTEGSRLWAFSIGTIVFILPATLIGTFLGAAIHTDRWTDVPLDRLRMGILPQKQGGVIQAVLLNF